MFGFGVAFGIEHDPQGDFPFELACVQVHERSAFEGGFLQGGGIFVGVQCACAKSSSNFQALHVCGRGLSQC